MNGFRLTSIGVYGLRCTFLRLVLAGGHASAWFSPFWRGPAPGAQRYQAPSSDKERDTTDAETDADTAAEEAWCPPMPDAPDDPTEIEIAGDADKLETMLRGSHPSVNIFFQPDNLGALPALWLQAKLTILLTSIQDKFAKLFMTIAAELWLRGRIDTWKQFFRLRPELYYSSSRSISEIFMFADETCRDTGHSETECLLYATYWFRPILSELIGAATESATVNRDRAQVAQSK